MKYGHCYVTTFCNFPHRMRDGVPIAHNCYVLPVEMLRAEWNGDTDRALEVLHEEGTGPEMLRGARPCTHADGG